MAPTDVIDAIGHTPLVRLRLGESSGVAVYAKLEMQNLFAMKDRVARRIILAARESGELKPDAPIVESSSGSMALGVALVGRALGHEVHIVTDPRIDQITLAKLRSLGCEVHIVPAMTSGGWQSARLELLDDLLARLPGAFWPQQYSNPGNPQSYTVLAAELLGELDHVDMLVASVGSGGSSCGTVRALREVGGNVRAVGVDSVGSMLFHQPDRAGRLQSGLGNSLMPANLDHSVFDEVHWLNDHEAFSATRRLAQEQQIFAGNTSGSVYCVLRHLARTAEPGSTVLGVFPDRGDRYWESVYSDEYWRRTGLDRQPIAEEPARVTYGTPVHSWSCSYPGGRLE
ncbi:PLP-dependent cysteine synthase family protein [Micromonospora sp. WMMC273]|uniref:PLP-dependent cysteine synthase family protein n=1 Tax=Micromonospora sp. WMMC273 TaxID=3015157 RepID=UPI0022B643B4|nr:cysteine synthase family protein [Micromonospora sp. WMMC273]MCZ7476246.1 cysteine synthase family protein [Micromonospora sp. WMMC273]